MIVVGKDSGFRYMIPFLIDIFVEVLSEPSRTQPRDSNL